MIRRSAAASASSMRYIPGNYGDALKHSWLIEIAQQLLSTKSADKGLVYIDAFAGATCYSYTGNDDAAFARDELRERWSITDMRKLTVYREYQQKPLDRGYYIGSTGLIDLLGAKHTRPSIIFAYDSDFKRKEYLRQRGYQVLQMRSGYEVLSSMELLKAADLVLFDDFKVYENYFPAYCEAAQYCSILVYLTAPSPWCRDHWLVESLNEVVIEHDADAFFGSCQAPSGGLIRGTYQTGKPRYCVKGEANYWPGMLFLPGPEIDDASKLLERLREATLTVAKAMGKTADESMFEKLPVYDI